MRKLYQNILFGAGRAYKSNNPIKNAYAKFIVYILSSIFHRQHYNYDELVNEVNLYNPNATDEEKAKIIKKVKKAYFRYRCTAREYFVFDLKNKTKKEIKEYLFDIEKIVLITLINSQKDLKLLNAKEKAYIKLKKYYKRDVVFIKNKTNFSFDEFASFVNKHNCFISKPSNSSLARGIKVFRLKNDDLTEDNIKRIYDDILSNTPVILEEFVTNDAYYSAFHPSSLNIVRVVVFKLRTGEAKIYRTYLSLGCGDKDFANGAAGAIAIPIDYKTGITSNCGYTESLKTFEKHPDSGLELRNIKLEKWDELLKLVQDLSNELPTLKYVGWDLACTPNGWVVVEGNGNAGQILYQLIENMSVRKEFMQYYNLT